MSFDHSMLEPTMPPGLIQTINPTSKKSRRVYYIQSCT